MLNERGHVAEHVNDVGLGGAPDRDLWRYAIEHRAVIVTKDEDFANMVAISAGSPSVLWIRSGNTRRSALLAWFEPLITKIVPMIQEGNRLIELR